MVAATAFEKQDSAVVFEFNTGGVLPLYNADAEEAQNRLHHERFHAEIQRRTKLKIDCTGVVRLQNSADRPSLADGTAPQIILPVPLEPAVMQSEEKAMNPYLLDDVLTKLKELFADLGLRLPEDTEKIRAHLQLIASSMRTGFPAENYFRNTKAWTNLLSLHRFLTQHRLPLDGLAEMATLFLEVGYEVGSKRPKLLLWMELPANEASEDKIAVVSQTICSNLMVFSVREAAQQLSSFTRWTMGVQEENRQLKARIASLEREIDRLTAPHHMAPAHQNSY